MDLTIGYRTYIIAFNNRVNPTCGKKKRKKVCTPTDETVSPQMSL
jgi:hypothetical protein